jgi:hypothetical protein
MDCTLSTRYVEGCRYQDGKVAVIEEIATTGEPKAIGLIVDRETLTADRRDVAHNGNFSRTRIKHSHHNNH